MVAVDFSFLSLYNKSIKSGFEGKVMSKSVFRLKPDLSTAVSFALREMPDKDAGCLDGGDRN